MIDFMIPSWRRCISDDAIEVGLHALLNRFNIAIRLFVQLK
jgi:hypothetical protein